MISLAQLLPHLLHQFSSEADLVKAVGELSAAFTTDRANIHRYLADPRLVSAYTAFYLTTNAPKLGGVLGWLSPELRDEILGLQLIDVGAGPGTFSLAWKLLGGKLDPVLWESAPLMREQAQRVLRGLAQTTASFASPVKGEQKRLLLFGHSANEMGESEAWGYVERADPEMVLFIEPGTPEVFALMLKLRQRFIQENWQIVYPCLQSGPCPLSASDWCHQYLRVRHEPDVERLTQLAHKDRRNLPVIVHVYRRGTPSAAPADLARLVRVHAPTKFSHEWEVCRPEGSALVHERFQLMFKHVARAEQAAVQALQAGDLISWESEKQIAQFRRIKLKPPSS